MNIKPEDVPKTLGIARLVVLALALICLFVLDLPRIAIALASLLVLFRLAMRNSAFSQWVHKALTGVPEQR